MLPSHEPEEGEDDEAGEHGGAGVDTADDESVFVDIVVVFVVRSQRHNSSQSESVGKENLKNVD